jgi:hypothetical protein
MDTFEVGQDVELTNDEYAPDIKRGAYALVVDVNEEFNLYEVETDDRAAWVHATDLRRR